MAKKSKVLSSETKNYLKWYKAPTGFRIIAFLIAYSVIRFSSWFLYDTPIALSILGFSLIILFGIVYFYKPFWGWYIVIIELFLGGAGHYIEIMGLSLRTLLLISFLLLWTAEVFLRRRYKKIWPHNLLWYVLCVFGLYLLIPTINGLLNGNELSATVQDLIPFAYLALIPATIEIVRRYDFKQRLIELGSALIIGNAFFSIVTLSLFSSGISMIQGPYYKWFRDITMGKVTDMGAGFFRIVTPEQLLVPAILLITTALIIHQAKISKTLLYIVWFAAMIIIVFNFSRAYLLGIMIGLVVLKYNLSWQKWIMTCTITAATFITILVGTHGLVSGGTSFGLDVLGIRTASFIAPERELSTHTRMTLLSPILMDIQEKPFFGHGLGSSVTFQEPFSEKIITTKQFDWGYLELLVEIGSIGTILYLIALILAGKSLFGKSKQVPKSDFGLYIGLTAALVSMLIIGITSPVLFHPLGIFLLMILFTTALLPISWYKKTEKLIENVILEKN